MLSILVVDDEPRHRKGLAEMIKRLRPGYSVSEAKNGEDALLLVSKNNVDVIITDIKMPIMDGLQFIESLGRKVKEIKIIILSAYGYFEYAQKAIALGAFDYLLKTVDEGKVIEMLLKVEAEIERESVEIKEMEGLKKQLDNTFPVYLELQLNKWLKGNLNAGELKEIEEIFPFKGAGTVLISRLCGLSSLMGSCSGDDVNEVVLNIKYWMKEAFNPIGHTISFFLQEEKDIMITVLNTRKKCDFLTDSILLRLQEFVNNLKVDYSIDAVVAIGNENESIFENINAVFGQVQMAADLKFFLEDNNIVVYSKLQSSISKQLFIKSAEEEELSDAIRKLSKEQALSILDGINGRILAAGYSEPGMFRDTIIHMLLNQLKIIQNTVNEDKFFLLNEDILKSLKQCSSFREMNAKVKQVISEIIDALGDQKHRRNDLVFHKCIEYINRNYAEELSLETVSEMFYFNPSYFSTLFKNQTGINFSQYLLGLRLKKGKELLEKTDFKVYEISAMVGYKDPKYFNRVFKKEFGLTPDEYRRL